jgi:hypothetical protein
MKWKITNVPNHQPAYLFPYAPCMDYYGIFINIYPKHHPNVNRSYMEHLGLMGKSKWEISRHNVTTKFQARVTFFPTTRS